jgi:hypothetical protein
MLRKHPSPITPAVREQQMVGFVLMLMLCCSPAYILVCIVRGRHNQFSIAAS